MENIFGVEEKATLLEKLPGMAFQCRYPSLPFFFVSEGCRALTGYTRTEIAEDMRFMDMVHPEDIEELGKLHEATLAIGAPMEASFRLLAKDGTEKTVLVRSRVSKTNSEGMPHIIEGLLVDITKQLRKEKTSQDNRENAGFWAKMGRGVRTPMNTILGLTEMGLREDMPDNIREYTRVIKKSGEDLMAALNAIMDYSKIESGELKLASEAYDFAELVNDVVNTIAGQVTKISFAVYIDHKIPRTLTGDPARLRRILLNMLSNALKFTDRGYVSLSITGTVEDQKIHLSFAIEDTGRGIKEEDMEALFKEFVQFDNKTIEGIGLGLTISRSLAKLMGGDIQVSSAFGVGSLFTVRLTQEVPPHAQSLCVVHQPEDQNILLFESCKLQQKHVLRTMKDLGVVCEVVSDIEAFQQAAASNTHNLILIDRKVYEECSSAYPLVAVTAEVVFSPRPLFCLPAADILNGIRQDDLLPPDKTSPMFTAPDARVLIVDDISANLMVAEGLLLPYQMQIELCESGADAIEALQVARYDLVLMDYIMPAMNGIETTARIRTQTGGETDCQHIPIIALTADTEQFSAKNLHATGFSDYLPKPIDPPKLNALIAKWIPNNKKQPISPQASQKVAVDVPDFEITGIDTRQGISMTGGNKDVYRRILKTYYHNGRTLGKELADCLQTGNMELYGIRMHALNSLSRTIGANTLSDSAAKLEHALERGDLSFILSHSPKFLKDMEKLLDDMQSVVSQVADDANTAIAKGVPVAAQIKKKILLIDDTEEYLYILNNILMHDYETLIALEGEDGLEAARLAKPDLILMDIVMPGRSGYEILKVLKADEALKDIPVVLISGKGQDKDKAKGYELGAAGYITKPFHGENIKETVANILN